MTIKILSVTVIHSGWQQTSKAKGVFFYFEFNCKLPTEVSVHYNTTFDDLAMQKICFEVFEADTRVNTVKN